MIHEHKEELYIKQDRLSDLLFDEESVFFNIETTGFSPTNAQIYLIGCSRKKGNLMIVDQFFASDSGEELEIIRAFLGCLGGCDTLISYNGVGFDLPFLKAKCDQYELTEHFSEYEYLDIFKSVSEIRFLFRLPNYKQKTLEEFLGLRREDPYLGGELINVYYDYQKTRDPMLLNTLMLHNYEDIIGMAEILPVLSYLEIFHGQYAITETDIIELRNIEGELQKELVITLHNDYPVPKRVSYLRHGYQFLSDDYQTTLHIPIHTGELRYFYPDYQNYLYVPDEDMAIHKSAAPSTDHGYREAANPTNCYNRKTGEFLPQYEEVMNPVYRARYDDTLSYFELTDDFRSSDIMLRRYVDHILGLFVLS